MFNGFLTRRSCLSALAFGAMLGLTSLLSGCASHGTHGGAGCCSDDKACKADGGCCKDGKCTMKKSSSKDGCCGAGKDCCAS